MLSEGILDALIERLLQEKPRRESARVERVMEIPGGWETDIFEVSVASRVDGRPHQDDFVLRAFSGPDAAARAHREFEAMRSIGQQGIPLPRVDYLLRADPIGENVYVVMERVEGTLLVDALAGKPMHRVRPMLNSMAGHFVRLHRIAWREVLSEEAILLRWEADPRAFVGSRLGRMRESIDRFKLQEFEPLYDWLEARSAGVETRGISLLHGDYHPENLIVRSDGSLAILDWSFVEAGDYRLDLAWAALQTELMLKGAAREFLLSTYEAVAGEEVESFEFFEALKFGERVVTIATWLDESVRIPVPKITRQAIRGGYKVHVVNVYRRLREITGVTLPLMEAL